MLLVATEAKLEVTPFTNPAGRVFGAVRPRPAFLDRFLLLQHNPRPTDGFNLAHTARAHLEWELRRNGCATAGSMTGAQRGTSNESGHYAPYYGTMANYVRHASALSLPASHCWPPLINRHKQMFI